jgi:hypothetical protein
VSKDWALGSFFILFQTFRKSTSQNSF